MKKILGKVLAFFLVVIVATTALLVFVPPIEASAATTLTENEFAAKIEELQSRYPHGQYWNEDNGTEKIAGKTVAKAGEIGCNGTRNASGEKCTSKGFCYNCTCKCGYFYGWQCFGFANLMAYHIFGSYATTGYNKGDVNSSKGWKYMTSVSTFFAGDIVRINNNHSIFIYKVTDSEVFYVDCNWGVPCQINWNRSMTIENLKSATTFVVRMEGNTLKGTGGSTAGTLTINYHANGGYIAANEDQYYLSSSIVYDGNTSSPACRVWQYGEMHKDGLHNNTTFSLYRDGYTFLGWSLSPDGGTVIDQNAVITPESIVPDIINGSQTVTMYAIWELNEDYESALYTWLFPVNNGGKIAFVYGNSSEYKMGFHYGIDIYSDGDQTIYAAFSGTVTNINNNCGDVHYPAEHNGEKCSHYSQWGNSIYIKSDDGKLYAVYGHLKQNSILVKKGQRVEAGDPIATMGSSGGSYNKHLHFEVRKSTSDGGMGSSSTAINVNPINSNKNKGVVAYTTSGYDLIVSDSIIEGTYKLSNDGYRIYTVSDKAAKGTLKVSDSAVDSKFDFTIVKDGNYYRIYPSSGGKNYFNAYWSDSQTTHTLHGSEVTLWGNDTSDYSQKWIFEKCGDGYLIHPACTPGFSLTRDGDKIVVKQTTNSANQIWKLETDINVPEEHHFSDWYVEYEATCTEDGWESRECEICGKYEMRDIPATGHDFTDWYIEYDATCTEDGLEWRDCVECWEYEERDIPAFGEHKFGEWYVWDEATCTDDGLEYRDCEVCGEYEERDIPATGHEFGDWYVDEEPTCTESGWEYRDCMHCSEWEEMEIPALGEHKFGEWYVWDEATCTDDGLECRDCDVCGEYEERDIPATGIHEFGEWSVWYDATCTETGLEYRDCENCSVYEEREIPAYGHSYGKWYTSVEPTCTEKGYKERDCAYCDASERIEIASFGGHNFGDWYVKYDATCIEDGLEYRECRICWEYEERVIPAIGEHSFGDWYTWNEPTCIDDGLESRDCDVCGEYETRDIPANGHDFGDWYVYEEPTCTAPGREDRDCANCSDYECREIPALGEHSFGEWYVEYDATCTEDGLESRECDICGEYEERDIPATGIHEFGDWLVWYDATCTEAGLEHRDCEDCGETEEREIPAYGHSYGKWYTSVEPTCTEKGYKERDCAYCDASERIEIASFGGHRFGNWTVDYEATCTEDGLEYRECNICGQREERIISANGAHTFGEWYLMIAPTCNEQGTEVRDCNDCGYNESRTIAGLNHIYELTDTAPTCTEQGYTTHICSLCGDSYVSNYLDATGHDYGEWITTKQPTATEDGVCEAACKNCGDKISEVIPATGEDTTVEETTVEETTAEETTAEDTTEEVLTSGDTTGDPTTEVQTDEESSTDNNNVSTNCSGVIHCATASLLMLFSVVAYVTFRKKQD